MLSEFWWAYSPSKPRPNAATVNIHLRTVNFLIMLQIFLFSTLIYFSSFQRLPSDHLTPLRYATPTQISQDNVIILEGGELV